MNTSIKSISKALEATEFIESSNSRQKLLDKEIAKKVYNEKSYRNISVILALSCLTLLGIAFYIFRHFNLVCYNGDGKQGYCLNIFQCPFVAEEINQGKELIVCKKDDISLEVCCVENKKDLTVPVLQSRFRDYSGKSIEKTENDLIQFPGPTHLTKQCNPHYKPPNVGRISHQKCLEYQKKYVTPCVNIDGYKKRIDNCNLRTPEGLITGGNNTFKGEFPHMVLLGYNTKDDEWQCAGIIISEKFILTAGHCTYSRDGGEVRKIRTGAWKRLETIGKDNIYKVRKIYKHYNYRPPKDYNDIALLETDRPMKLNRYALPACLHDGVPVNDSVVMVPGWGINEAQHKPDYLQKVQLERFSDEECDSIYKPKYVRNMPDGFHKQTQVCYGDKISNKDSCLGDSGGPAVIYHPTVDCMHLVMAVTSMGKFCGVAGSPGVYTRVDSYLDWIESIVWPKIVKGLGHV